MSFIQGSRITVLIRRKNRSYQQRGMALLAKYAYSRQEDTSMPLV